MSSMLSLIRGASLALILTASLSADPAVQPQVSFTAGSASTWNADWIGVSGRTYFAQGSVDLVNWEYLPVLEFGTGIKGAGINTTGASKYFLRLAYSDTDWVTTEQQARDADFDGDGIPNWFEVDEVGSDPFDKTSAGGDQNGNGLPDGWERFYYGGLGLSDPNAIGFPNGDGLSNKEKSQLGLDPSKDYSNPASPPAYAQLATFTYDNAGRLTVVSAPVISSTYSLDQEGNILTAQ